LKEILIDANALAAFSNLKDNEMDFRQNYPDFLPDIWSGASIVIDTNERSQQSTRSWRVLQEQLIDAWRNGFTLDDCVGLIGHVAKFSQLEIAMQKLEKDMMHSNKIPTGPFPSPETWPFQRAVMFLGMNPWRASICSRCGNRYVKDKSTRRFCSDKCFQESRLLSKRNWWSEHAKEIKKKGRRK